MCSGIGYTNSPLNTFLTIRSMWEGWHDPLCTLSYNSDSGAARNPSTGGGGDSEGAK